MAHTPLVSVIIPNFNYAKYLRQSIESVLNQTYENIELIVVDDGSTDDSVEILRNYSGCLRLIEQKNSGVSVARNTGLEFANGDYICFLDSDDSWEPHKIMMQISKFSSEEVGVVYSAINICDDALNKEEISLARYKGEVADLYLKYPTRAIVNLGCSSAMIEARLAKMIGGFDADLNTSADWDYFRRLTAKTRVDFVDTPLVNYRRHKQSMSSSSLENYYFDNEKAVIKLLVERKQKSGYRFYFLNSYSIWVRFQKLALKAHLKNKDFQLAQRHFLSLFQPKRWWKMKDFQKSFTD